jgi:hypothetical protein
MAILAMNGAIATIWAIYAKVDPGFKPQLTRICLFCGGIGTVLLALVELM